MISSELKDSELELKEFKSSGLGSDVDEDKLKSRIRDLKKQVDSLQGVGGCSDEEIAEINDNNRESYRNIADLEEKKAKLKKAIDVHENNLNSNSGKLNGILESLINALMSRRKLVENWV